MVESSESCGDSRCRRIVAEWGDWAAWHAVGGTLRPGGGRSPNRGKDPAGYDLFFFDARSGIGGSSINSGRSPWVTSALGELWPRQQASGLGLEFVGGEGVVQVACPLLDPMTAVWPRIAQKTS